MLILFNILILNKFKTVTISLHEDLRLYYTKLAIGTPSRDFNCCRLYYYVQVNTGSQISWVNSILLYRCIDYGFPVVTLIFQNSLKLTVHPHDYIYHVQESELESKEKRGMTVLGELVLAGKLVVYDLESQVIGWTKHNCFSSIKVKDNRSGNVYTVGSHHLSYAYGRKAGDDVSNVCSFVQFDGTITRKYLNMNGWHSTQVLLSYRSRSSPTHLLHSKLNSIFEA